MEYWSLESLTKFRNSTELYSITSPKIKIPSSARIQCWKLFCTLCCKGFVSILKLFLLSCKLALWIIYITLNAYRITLCNIYRIVKVQRKIDCYKRVYQHTRLKIMWNIYTRTFLTCSADHHHHFKTFNSVSFTVLNKKIYSYELSVYSNNKEIISKCSC